MLVLGRVCYFLVCVCDHISMSIDIISKEIKQVMIRGRGLKNYHELATIHMIKSSSQ